MTITEFLRARYAEQEVLACAAHAESALTGVFDEPFITHKSEAVAEHVVAHSPGPVLADLSSKRRILDECSPVRLEDYDESAALLADVVLAALASAFREHPDYDAAWVGLLA